MKIFIEIMGGLITNITATEPASIYIFDHDVLKEGDLEDLKIASEASQPDFVCSEDQITTLINTMVQEYKEEIAEWTQEPS